MSARETFSPDDVKNREIVKSKIVDISRTKPETKSENKPKDKPETKPEIIIDNSGILKEFKKFEKNILDQINLGGAPSIDTSIDTSKYGMIQKSKVDRKIIVLAFILGLFVLGYYKKDWLMEKYLAFKFRNDKSGE